MKTYILRPFKTVDAQKLPPQPAAQSSAPPAAPKLPPPPVAARPGIPVDPAAAAVRPRPHPKAGALIEEILNVPTGKKHTLFIGLDVHNDTIAVSLAPSDSIEVRRYGIIGGSHDDVLKLAKKLQAAHPEHLLKFCYEAGPRGYPLCRFLQSHGYHCIIVSPSCVPRRPGDRVKTDRRDADQLARLYRAGELTGIHVPEPQDEAVRDLLRGRYQVIRHQHRARQQLKMFLLRHNIRYGGQTSWNAAHLRYLARIKMPFAEQQFVFQEMLHLITEAGPRLERYEKEIALVVLSWRWAPVVSALMSLRGMALLNAATLVAELGDLHRFEHPAQLMGYLGLVPSEDTTGDDRQQGGLTKMGNGYGRRALIEAAWHYRAPARITPHLQRRQEGLPKAVTDIAWKAQVRLHGRFQHLLGVGRKKSQVAAAAVARELCGFVWAIARTVAPHAQAKMTRGCRALPKAPKAQGPPLRPAERSGAPPAPEKKASRRKGGFAS